MNTKIMKRILSGIASTCVAICTSATAFASNSTNSYIIDATKTETSSEDLGSLKGEMYIWIHNNLSNTYYDDTEKQRIIEEYLNSSEFVLQYQVDRQAALDTIITKLEINNRIKQKENQVAPRGVYNNGSLYSCTVNTSIVQEKDTWCGVGSTLMALTGISSHNSYSLISNYTEPTQTQISKEVIPRGETTAYVYAIANYLNSQLTTSKYVYTEIRNNTTVAELTNHIKYSLAAGRPVILNAAPYGTLSYYNGSGIDSSYRHYIVVDGYDRSSDTFWVADCTYHKKYQGRHYRVSPSEIRDCVEGNYIIHA